jgi:uncharacterized membrane protein
MNNRTTVILALVLIGLAIAGGLMLWNQLPDEMASHWNMNDQVDGTTSKFWGVFLMPLVASGLLAILMLVPFIDPHKANIEQFRGTLNLFIVLITVFLLYLHALTIAWNLGYQNFRISSALLPALGLLFIFIGYLLRQAKRNFFIGIRTPWTLSSDTVWNKTHQLGSVLFMISGALALLGAWSDGMTALLMIFIPLMGSTLFLVVYSYILYRNETKS